MMTNKNIIGNDDNIIPMYPMLTIFLDISYLAFM